jgi:hypothetical protein
VIQETLTPELPLRVIDPRTIPEWDLGIQNLPEATVFHSSAWCQVICESYRYQPVYLAKMEAGRPKAFLPMIEVDSRITGRRGICLPFTDECGPLFDETCSRQQFREQALSLGRERGWKYLEIRQEYEAGQSLSFYSHELRIDRGADELFKGLDSSVRRGIRKAEGSGLTISIAASEEAVAKYYRLHRITRKRHGVPPQPFRFFKNISKYILGAGHGFIVLAELAGKPVASAVFFCFGGKSVYKFGASDERYQQFRPNNLVMWEGIKELSKAGNRVVSFGRTSLDNEGLRRFKLGWGSSERVVSYLKQDVRSGKILMQRDNASGLHSLFFRSFPLWVNQAAGSVVYRHLA